MADDAGIYNLDFSEILGAQRGETGASANIMEILFDVLQKGEYEGTQDYDWMEGYVGHWSPKWSSPSGGGLGFQGEQRNMNLEDWEEYLTTNLAEGGAWYGDIGPGGGHSANRPKTRPLAEGLLSMLQHIQMPEITSEYKEQYGDVSAETASQKNLLLKKLVGGGKGSRFQSLAGGGKGKGGGRKKYLSDFYNLASNESQMVSNIQDELTESFKSNVSDWLDFNPSV